jgi:phosphoglucosamine mutase
VVGKDTRLSGYLLENAVSAGILSMGVDVLFIGPLPTPGIAYATRSLRADAGIAITASHNPYDDNGVKFFRSDGYKLDEDIEAEIENLVFSGEIEKIRPRPAPSARPCASTTPSAAISSTPRTPSPAA